MRCSPRGRRKSLVPILLLLLASAAGCRRTTGVRARAAAYVGAERCAPCHEEVTARWKTTSHGNHAFPASPDHVKGDFQHKNVYVYRGVTSRMWTEDGKYFMETEGPDGAYHTYPIDIVLGWRQTQVYLTRFPDGRYQTLPIYYDLEERVWYDQTEGVVPSGGRKLTPKDQGYWANRGRTWNSGCSGCHGSQVEKGYDAPTNTYRTTWVDLTINCEACHGPGSLHVEAWTKAGTGGRVGPDEGELVDLKSLPPEKQVEACARCHAAKTTVARGFRPGEAFLEYFQPAVPSTERQFFADGRNKGLNYNYIAHIQSECYRKGNLTCTGCHDPHGSGYPVDLREPGDRLNPLCLSCHAEMKANLAGHTHHPDDSPGSQCVGCHMPFVDILGRRIQARDHTISVPVPAVTKHFGVPNACNTCHRDRDPEWAAESIRKWFNDDQKDRIDLAAAFFFGYRKDPVVPPVLQRLFLDRGALPPPRRAGIPMILAAYQDPSLLAPLVPALVDPEEDRLVRFQVTAALASVPGRSTEQALLKAVTRPERALRRLAGVELARRGVKPRDSEARHAIEGVVREYEELVKGVRADIPEDQAGLGDIYLARGEEEKAMERYLLALELGPDQPEVQIRLGTLYAKRNQTDRAAECFRAAADLLPRSAIPVFNLGSLYLQSDRAEEAILHLSRALEIDPDHPEARYNLAVAQVEGRQFEAAIGNLRQVLADRPRNPMVLFYLGRAYEGHGKTELALDSYRKALEIAPNLSEVREALSKLSAAAGSGR